MQTLFHSSNLTLLPYIKKAPIYLIPLAGLVLILFADHLTTLLPYVLGPVMILEGIMLGIPAIRSKEYKVIETKATAAAVVLCIVGILILYKHKDCLQLMGTVWGLYGLISGTHELNEAFYRMSHRQKFWLPLIEAVITLILAVLLLADPFHSFVHHVQILGIELIVSVFRPDHHEVSPRHKRAHHSHAQADASSDLEQAAQTAGPDEILSSYGQDDFQGQAVPAAGGVVAPTEEPDDAEGLDGLVAAVVSESAETAQLAQLDAESGSLQVSPEKTSVPIAL